MRVYLTTAQIPELAGLSTKQRKFVWQRCVYPLLRQWCVLLTSLVVFVASLLIAYSMLGLIGGWAGILAIFGVGLSSYLHDMAWAAHYRPQIRQFIDKHAPEMETVS